MVFPCLFHRVPLVSFLVGHRPTVDESISQHSLSQHLIPVAVDKFGVGSLKNEADKRARPGGVQHSPVAFGDR